jgi:hypothetical protein
MNAEEALGVNRVALRLKKKVGLNEDFQADE